MIRIIAVGKIKEKSLRELIAEYTKRISGYDRIEILETDEEKIPASNSEAENGKAMEAEGKRLLEKVKPGDYMVLLDLAGEMTDSVKLSEKIEKIRTYESGTIDFVIGGSLGTSKEVKKRANWKWKLSDLTFPHQLARLVVLEQIYRSFKIQHNEPYHK